LAQERDEMKRRMIASLICLGLLCGAGCAKSETETTTLLTEPILTGEAAESDLTIPTTETDLTSAADVPTETAEAVSLPTTETAPSLPESTEPSENEPDPVEAMLMNMTLEERVAQMFVVTPEALTGGKPVVTEADGRVRAAFDRIPVGGLLLMGYNLKNPDQVRNLCDGLQALSRDRTGLPLFLCVDEEGGSVARVSGNEAFGLELIPPMAEVGATGDPEAARAIGRRMGTYLRDLGFNVDFAPDADVLTNPENRVVRDRSFGSDPSLVTELAAALSQGLLEEGVLPCWKHFPGHGGTAEDSHKGFAVLHLDPETPEDSPELQPFLAAVESGMPMIMTGHITVPELDPAGLPASLSPVLLSLLRGPERNYAGLLITDALGMGAVTERFGPGEAAVLAVLAGNDLLLATEDPETAWRAVLEAVRDGTIPEARIDESVYRILRTKNDLP
jgi:beta-N-acetylhexosaminidase